MRRHAVASIAAAAVAVATSFAGLAGAVTDPIELLGWGQAPDTYDFETGLLSSDGKYVWMGASTSPGWIIKFMTNPGGISPTHLGTLQLPEDENNIYTMFFSDASEQYAVVSATGDPYKILKINLGAGAADPTRVGALELPGLQLSTGGVAYGLYAYYGFFDGANKILKVAMGNGDALPTRLGEASLLANDWVSGGGAVIHGPAGKAYFATGMYGGNEGIVKISIGAGANDPVRDSALDLTPLSPIQGAIDITNDLAYWLAWDNGVGVLMRIDLNSYSAAAPEIIGSTLEFDGGCFPESIALDLAGDYAYVSCDGIIQKVKLNGPAGIMAVEETLDVTNATDEELGRFKIALYDASTGLLYMGPYWEGMCLKIGTKGIPPIPPPPPTPDGSLATLRGAGTRQSARGKRATVTLRLTAPPANSPAKGSKQRRDRGRRALYNAVEKTPKPFNTTAQYRKHSNAYTFYEVVLDLPAGVRPVKVGAPAPVRASAKPVIADDQVFWPLVPLREGRAKPQTVTLKVTVLVLPAAQSPLTFNALALKLPDGPATYMSPSVDVVLKA